MAVPGLWRKEYFPSSHYNQNGPLLGLGLPDLRRGLNETFPRYKTRGFGVKVASSLMK